MYRFHKYRTLTKVLKKKRTEKIKSIYIEEYTDSIFPNNDLLRFKNVEHFIVRGKQRLRKNKSDSLLKPTQIRIDTNGLNQLTNLKYLQFEYIDFDDFPIEICFLKQLKGLSFSFCFIDSIPEEISNLKSLEVFEFRLNNIKFLPKGISSLNNLLILDLINNSFAKLPKEILEIKKINFSNVESREDINEADYRWPYPIHTNKIDYYSHMELFTEFLKMPQLQKTCISVDDSDKKTQMKNKVFDKLLLKKICW